MKVHSFVVVLSVVVVSVLHAALARAEAASESADATCADVSTLAEKTPASKIVALFEGSDERTSKPTWRVMANVEALKKAVETEQSYWQAYLWRGSGALLVKLVKSSESGDWAQFVDYCFDSSGHLLRMVGTLNTFYGNVTRIRTSYFEKSGVRVGSNTRVLDLQSRKAISDRTLASRDFMDEDDPVYLTVEAAPFKELFSP